MRRGWRWKAWAGAVGGGAGSAWVDGFRGGQSAGSVTSYAGSVTSPTSHTSLASVHIHTHHWAHHGAPTLALTDSHHIASDVRVYVCGELRPRTRVKPLARDLCFPIFRGDWRRVAATVTRAWPHHPHHPKWDDASSQFANPPPLHHLHHLHHLHRRGTDVGDGDGGSRPSTAGRSTRVQRYPRRLAPRTPSMP